MPMQIHCPGCGVQLEVPTDAGGRAARCPGCKTKFRIPDPRSLLDETVTAWLNVEEEEDDTPPPPPEPNKLDKPKADAPKPDTKRVRRKIAGSQSAANSDKDKDKAKNHASGSFVVKRDKPKANTAEHRLHITGHGSYGVKIAFPSSMLDNLAFRASMPLKSVISCDDDRTRLVARPLAWVDKATGHFTNPSELEGRYELEVRQHQDTVEIAKSMATLSELPSPFNQAMPYYVSGNDKPRHSVHCETVASPSGIQCEVTIPCPAYALEWVGRVNGICGEDYATLEAEVNKLDTEAWSSIPDKVRGRLAVWFDFQNGEEFLGYFLDADLTKSDAGLGGLIVTDQRLVFTKYHQHGSVPIESGSALVVVAEGRFATLYHTHNKTKRKIVRLRSADVELLADLVATLPTPIDMYLEESVDGADSSTLDDMIEISDGES